MFSSRAPSVCSRTRRRPTTDDDDNDDDAAGNAEHALFESPWHIDRLAGAAGVVAPSTLRASAALLGEDGAVGRAPVSAALPQN
jgi:hypothetical protein